MAVSNSSPRRLATMQMGMATIPSMEPKMIWFPDERNTTCRD